MTGPSSSGPTAAPRAGGRSRAPRGAARAALRAGAGRRLLAALLLCAALPAAPDPVRAEGPQVGPVTGLPLPRYVSLKATRANMRRGPAYDHRIDWVLVRRGLPLQVIAEYGQWRRVRDMEGASGWVYHGMLSGRRTAVVRGEEAALRLTPDAAAAVSARAEAGVILRVEACGPAWCEVAKDGAEGWLPKTALWGVDPAESFD